MINQREVLTIKIDDGATIADISDNLSDYNRDTETVTLLTTDFMYVGFYKPFNTLYARHEVANINPANLSLEVWNGSGWSALKYRDETKAFSRDGFLNWEKSSMQPTAIDSDTKYWIRLSVDADSSAIEFQALNILFSDKQSSVLLFSKLEQVVNDKEITEKLVAAKREIMDRLDRRGYVKYDDNLDVKDLTPFDLHDVYQVRQASSFFVLAHIFFDLSDDPSDHWWAKYETYQAKAEQALSLFKLDVDLDDDGLDNESNEQKKKKTIRWSR